MRAYVSFAPGEIDGEAVTSPDDLPRDMTKDVLGGKGWGLVQLCARGYPVPPGFIVTTGICRAYQRDPQRLMAAIAEDLPDFTKELRGRFNGSLPLMSVRSGAPVSMPGMMDTILNVGMIEATYGAWENKLGALAAADCRRRFAQMYGEIVLGVDKDRFHKMEAKALEKAGASHPMQLTAWKLRNLGQRYEAMLGALGHEVPDDPHEQLLGCIEAVFKSWNTERAIHYRQLNKIDDTMGTAVVVQAMVFGNAGETSGTGVCFTRDPSTGDRNTVGEFLVNAQGEDVVAGTHKPVPFKSAPGGGLVLPIQCSADADPVEQQWPSEICEALSELLELGRKIETDHGDMQDIEFTIQNGKLWLLQTRTGKRSAAAAFAIARDLVEEGLWDEDDIPKKLTLRDFSLAQRPVLNVEATEASIGKPIATGVVGSTGALAGRVAFTLEDIVHIAAQGDPVILVRHETTPDDIKLLAAAQGVLTATGGFTSHAAVVARGMNKICITGCEALDCLEGSGSSSLVGEDLDVGQWLTLDGATGNVYFGQGVLSGGDSTAAVDMVRKMMAEKDLRLRTSTATPGAYVLGSEMLQLGPDRAKAWISDALDKGLLRDCVLDLHTLEHELEDEYDVAFIRATTSPTLEQKTFDAVMDCLADTPTHGMTLDLILPNGCSTQRFDVLKAYGYRMVTTISTLEDAIVAGGPVLVGPTFRALAGSERAWDALSKLLTDLGCSTEIDRGVTLGEAAARLFES